MKRIIFLLVAILVVFGIIYFRLYPDVFTPFFAPTITPLSFLIESISTPERVPTLEPTEASPRSIPVPNSIPTLDYVKDLVISNNPATLEFANDWTSVITLDFDGFIIKIDPGKNETQEFPPGDYNYSASAPDCGSPQINSILLEANNQYSIRFYCSSNGIFGDQPGTNFAILEVTNRSSKTISLTINDQTYQVPHGTMDIRLAPGTYTYRASAPGVMGTSETITLSPGTRFSVSFFISSFP